MKTLIGVRKEEGIFILSFETEKRHLRLDLRILKNAFQCHVHRTIFAIKHDRNVQFSLNLSNYVFHGFQHQLPLAMALLKRAGVFTLDLISPIIIYNI